MEIYTTIADWSGWPPIVAFLILMGGIGLWVYQKHIDILKEQIKLLERSLGIIFGYFIEIPFTINEFQNIPEVKQYLGL